MLRLPGVDEVRPARCPCCDAPSRPMSQAIVVQGHGLRDRQIRGPLVPGGPPMEVVVQARRYRCTACHAVVLVVPRGVTWRRLYSLHAIAWALARMGFDKATTRKVRGELSPAQHIGVAAAERWVTAIRWLDARRQGLLFPSLGIARADTPRRVLAERTAMQLVAQARPGHESESLCHRAWHGAAQAA